MHKSKVKPGFLERSWQLQNNIEQKMRLQRINKEQRYREFLADPTRPLPSYETLKKWRKTCLVVILLLMIIPVGQTLLFYNTLWSGWTHIIPGILGVINLVVAGFTASLDWAIYKRWGHKFSIIEW